MVLPKNGKGKVRLEHFEGFVCTTPRIKALDRKQLSKNIKKAFCEFAFWLKFKELP